MVTHNIIICTKHFLINAIKVFRQATLLTLMLCWGLSCKSQSTKEKAASNDTLFIWFDKSQQVLKKSVVINSHSDPAVKSETTYFIINNKREADELNPYFINLDLPKEILTLGLGKKYARIWIDSTQLKNMTVIYAPWFSQHTISQIDNYQDKFKKVFVIDVQSKEENRYLTYEVDFVDPDEIE
jgi:hypothetical protein